jgi:hypothetical protein
LDAVVVSCAFVKNEDETKHEVAMHINVELGSQRKRFKFPTFPSLHLLCLTMAFCVVPSLSPHQNLVRQAAFFSLCSATPFSAPFVINQERERLLFQITFPSHKQVMELFYVVFSVFVFCLSSHQVRHQTTLYDDSCVIVLC